MKRVLWSALVLACLAPAGASAAPDGTFGLGNGHDGAFPPASPAPRPLNTYAGLTAQPDGFHITVTDGSQFIVGDSVLIWQADSMPAGASNVSTPVTPTGSTGQRELARITAKDGGNPNLLTVTSSDVSNSPLLHSTAGGGLPFSTAAGATQVVRLPEFTTVAMGGSDAFNAKVWDGVSGGIVGFLASGAVTMASGSVISATGAGFNGGAAGANAPGIGGACAGQDLASPNGGPRGEGIQGTLAGGFNSGFGNVGNGGGGGNCIQNGGGGGGNAGAGGIGGEGPGALGTELHPGSGGAPINYSGFSLTDHMTMGGGGGAGNNKNGSATGGRKGGGVVFIRAASLTLTGSAAITANGAGTPTTSTDDGQGGGGAGGTIYIRLTGAIAGCNGINANGSGGISAPNPTGTNPGAGGGGGGGRVLIQASSTSGCNATFTGGNGGGASGGNAATDGAAGSRELLSIDARYCSTENTPACGAGLLCNGITNTCVECSDSTDCPLATPVCNTTTATCENCTALNNGEAECQSDHGSRHCLISNGDCVGCVDSSHCANPTGSCNLTTHSCVACNDPSASGCVGNPAGDVCNPASGQCVECLANADCGNPAKPSCRTSDHTCQPCTDGAFAGDAGCVGHTGTLCKPVAGTCVSCLTNSQCTNPTGSCSQTTNTCVACDAPTNNGCAGNAAGNLCNTTTHACVECLGNADCANPTGSCNQSTNKCVACDAPGNNGCNGNATGNFCNNTSHNCVACLNNSQCTNPTGSCSQATNTCVACDAPSNNGCTNNAAGNFCNTSTHNCVQCLANGDCPAAAAPQCTSNSCVACSGNAGCVGHTQPNCETAATANVGRCVECRSNNTSADCAADTAPECKGNNTCGGCTADSICNRTQHGFKHCEVSGECEPCRVGTDTDCPSSTDPICANAGADNVCSGCSADNQCDPRFGVNFVCDTPTGDCVGCVTNAECLQPSSPKCVSRSCTDCVDDTDCTFHADGGLAACANDTISSFQGQCRQCSFNNTSACVGANPACNFENGQCQLCTVTVGDAGAQSTGCATDPAGHACQGSGTSVFCGCTTDADCGGATSGRICDGISHLCKDGCSRAPSRNNCPTAQFCTTNDTTGSVTGVCTMNCQFDVDCSSNMPTMPFCIGVSHDDAGADAGTMGRCAGCRTDGDCGGGTPVCEPTLKICVECTDTRTEACMSTGSGTICLPNETCGCSDDTQCGAADSGRICDTITTHKCTSGCRVLGGNGCPAGLICDGAGLVPGKCVAFVDMAMNIPDASEPDLSVPVDMTTVNLKLTGGGIGCSLGGRSDVSSWSVLLLLALAALGLRRRRS